MKKIFLFLFVLGYLIHACKTRDCKSIPTRLASYSIAIKTIKSSSYKLRDSIDVDGSSFMTSASYYSCDGQVGYFLYTRKYGNEYFHANVPFKIWNEFKNTDFKDSFYREKIEYFSSGITIVVELNTNIYYLWMNQCDSVSFPSDIMIGNKRIGVLERMEPRSNGYCIGEIKLEEGVELNSAMSFYQNKRYNGDSYFEVVVDSTNSVPLERISVGDTLVVNSPN